MSTADAILAVHVGDAYIRAAYLDHVNQPTSVEDAGEFQKYATPSLVTLDPGGALLGYPALMAAQHAMPHPLVWRYSRSDLCQGGVMQRDVDGRGLTAAAFTALAVRRMVRESTAWTASKPHIVLAVPDVLTPLARLNLATMVGDAAELPVALVGEAQALATGLQLAPSERPTVVLSFDDDALQLRLVRPSATGVEVLATQTHAAQGMQSLRAAWFSRWNADAMKLLAGVTAFDSAYSPEFEKIWQDIWQCLDGDPRFKAAMPSWTVVRHSTVAPLVFSRAAAEAELSVFAAGAVAGVDALLAAAACPASRLAGLILIAPKGLGRILAPQLASKLGVANERVRCETNSIYAEGAARGYARAPQPGYTALAQAPSNLGALGVAKDDTGLTFKQLIAAATPLPATASFSIMANRDQQRRLVIKLASQTAGGQAELQHQAEFGPLQGQGMLKVKVNVHWTADGRLSVTALDGESELSLPSLQAHAMAATGPLLGVADILRWD